MVGKTTARPLNEAEKQRMCDLNCPISFFLFCELCLEAVYCPTYTIHMYVGNSAKNLILGLRCLKYTFKVPGAQGQVFSAR